MSAKKVSDEIILETYKKQGNMHAVSQKLNLSVPAIKARLVKLKYPVDRNPFVARYYERTEEQNKKHSLLCKGRSGKWKRKRTPEDNKKVSDALKGRVFSNEHRKKLSESQRGNKNHEWKGGITKERLKIWKSTEYKLWRQSVFERDNFICQWCGEKNIYLEAHHIKAFEKYVNLRFNINNGISLCKKCHDKTKNGTSKNEKFKEIDCADTWKEYFALGQVR